MITKFWNRILKNTQSGHHRHDGVASNVAISLRRDEPTRWPTRQTPPLAIFINLRSQMRVEHNLRFLKHHVFPKRLFTAERDGYVEHRLRLKQNFSDFISALRNLDRPPGLIRDARRRINPQSSVNGRHKVCWSNGFVLHVRGVRIRCPVDRSASNSGSGEK